MQCSHYHARRNEEGTHHRLEGVGGLAALGLLSLCLVLISITAMPASAEVIIGEYVFEKISTGSPYPASESASSERAQLIWASTISYPGAVYIAPHFDYFHLPAGDVLVIRSVDGSQDWSYRGLGRAGLGKSEEGFFATHIKGDTAVIELYSVNGAKPLSQHRDFASYGVTIDYYGRGYSNAELTEMWAAGLGEILNLAPPIDPTEAICGVDDTREAKCYQSSEPAAYGEARAVARLMKNGNAHCTGWLVGCEGHIITNEHCIGSQAELNSIDFEFMAEGASCATNCASSLACAGTIEASGGTLVAVDAGLDYALVQPASSGNLSNTYGYMQLRDTGAVLGERIYIPQHPAGWGKRLALESTHPADGGLARVNSVSEAPCSGSGYNDVGYFADTQGGSSGSPVLGYDDNLVIALHHCANCENRGVPIPRIITDLGANLPDCAIGGGAPPPPPPPSNCASGSIDFNSLAITSYAGQDQNGTTTVADGGDTLVLTGNNWKRSTSTFTVTANTVVEFEFASSSQGEIHALGFDENDTLNDAPRLFQFWGTQNWTGTGQIDLTPKYTGGGAFQSYSIPVGQSYTGSMNLAFVNDKDSGTANNEGRFRCVRIFEDGAPPPPPPPPPATCTVDDDFESGAAGWSNAAGSTCSTGAFTLTTPTQQTSTVVTQVGGDHTSGSGNAIFTATNTSAGNADVDGGNCILESPTWSVSSASTFSVWYFHGQRDSGDDPGDDFFLLEVSTNGGSSYTPIVNIGDVRTVASWTNATASIPAGSNVKLRVQVSDGSGPGDIVEGGIDDLSICSQ